MFLNSPRQISSQLRHLLGNLLCLVCLVVVNAGCRIAPRSSRGPVESEVPQQKVSRQKMPAPAIESGLQKQAHYEPARESIAPPAERPDTRVLTLVDVNEVKKQREEPSEVTRQSTVVPPESDKIVSSEKKVQIEAPASGTVGAVISKDTGQAVVSSPGKSIQGEISAGPPEALPHEAQSDFPRLSNPDMADEMISVNFDQVDIRVVLKTIGDITGINFVLDEKVRGTVTVMSPTMIKLGDIYGFLEKILEVNGYAAVPAGDLVKIVPRADAVKRSMQVRIGNNPSDISKGDSIITQIIPLHYANAVEVGEIVRPFLSANSYMVAYAKTNSILIADTSSNIYHAAAIIANLDVENSREQVTIIPLKYASAKVLSELITSTMSTGGTSSIQAVRSRTASPQPAAPQIETGMRILPEIRTNSLIVVANESDTQKVRQLVGELDVERPNRAGNFHVVYLKNAPAKETAASFNAALANLKITGALEDPQGVQVAPDEGTNSLIITASPQDYEVIADIIEKLDVWREQVWVESLFVEVSEDDLKEIGVDWATLDEAVADSVRVFGTTSFGPRVDFLTGDLEGLGVGAWKGTESDIGVILNALEKKNAVNILSAPQVLTSNHNKARIVVGENIPVIATTRITETDPATPTAIHTFEYHDVGIILEITPHVSQGGLVRLEINSEFKKLVESVTVKSSISDYTPTTAVRQAQTNVTMNSGSTVVIGGLIRDDKVIVENKVPLLGDLPLIGNLFKLRKDRLQKTNLLIFITPHVMGSQQDLDRITAEKKKQMDN